MAFVPSGPRILVQSRVRFCASLHNQVPGERAGQSTAVRLQGSGLHPWTGVAQVPLQRGVGQVRGDTIKPCTCFYRTQEAARVGPNHSVRLFRPRRPRSATFGFSTCSARPSSLVTSTSTHQTDPPPRLTKTSEKCRAGFLEGRPDPSVRPSGLLAAATVGLFRMLTLVALWAGSALTKVKTPPYASPAPLQPLQQYPGVKRANGIFGQRREGIFAGLLRMGV